MKILAVTNLFPTERAAPRSARSSASRSTACAASGSRSRFSISPERAADRPTRGWGVRSRRPSAPSAPTCCTRCTAGCLPTGPHGRPPRANASACVHSSAATCSGAARRPGHADARATGRAGLETLARSPAGVIVKSQGLEPLSRRHSIRRRVWVIPDGVDTQLFTPTDRQVARAALGWPAICRTVLFTAATSRPEKRFDRARAAFEALERRRGDVELVLLRAFSARRAARISAADVVLLTSSTEGSPNVVKEALACCTPIVSVDVGDVRERIDGIVGNAVVEPTPDALAAALVTALEAPRDPRARERAASVSLERTAEQTRAVYEAVLDGSPAPGADQSSVWSSTSCRRGRIRKAEVPR